MIIISILVLFIISIIVTGFFVKKVTGKFSQPFLEEGPKHNEKIGTPTMGGVAFICLYLITMLILILFQSNFGYKINVNELVIIFIVILGFFFIGFKDDYDKVTHNENSKGLSAKTKLFFQILLGAFISLILFLLGFSTNIDILVIPQSIDLGFLYYIFIIFLLVATTNATNLTDGVDGLLSANIITTLISLSIIALIQSNQTILISNIVLIITLLAFYLYNKNPAKVFMGDVGSLSLGGYLCIVAILLKVEVLFFFFSIIYFLETLSVIFQVSYFKYTKKKYGQGKKIFLMTPIHHHFEKKGYSEKNIVRLFVCINIIFSCLGLLIYI